ncbi:MAG: FGGY family carbohydrate kinase [Candidatus Bathyarchaeia archaeon]
MSLIGLDIGTTGCKAAVFTPKGELLSIGYREYSHYSPKPGWIELNPEEIWVKLKGALRDISKGEAGKPQALGISALGEAILPMDKGGHPLYPAITAYDQRGETYRGSMEILRRELGDLHLFKLTGIPLNSMPSIHKIIWIKENMPDIFEQTWKFVCIEDYIIYKLTGETAIDYNLASRTMMFDIHKKEWCNSILEIVGITDDLLSQPVPSGTIVGEVTSEASDETGLPRGLGVAPGGHDQACGALGVGVADEGPTMDATGSVECIASAMEKPILTEHMLEAGHCCHCHTVEGRYISLGFFPSSGLILRWFRDQFASDERRKAEQSGINVYDLLVDLASKSPPGASKMLMLPHFSGGGTGPRPALNRNSRGAFIGLTPFHKREDVVRAILEGVAFELKVLIDHFEASGIKVSELRAVGGGAKSSFWLQLKADITGKRICLPKVTEATLLGAALLSGIGANIYGDYKEAIKETYQTEKIYEPDSILHDKYSRLYKVYKMIYPALVDIYEKLASI